MQFNKHSFFLAVSLSALAACSGAKMDGTATKASFSMQLQNVAVAASPTLLRALNAPVSDAGSSVTITAASAEITKIKLKLPEGISCAAAGFVAQDGITCEDETEIENGVSVVEAKIVIRKDVSFDLIAGTTTPDLGTLTLPSGLYKKVELEGKSLTADGSFTDSNGVSRNLHLAMPFDAIKIENATGLEVLNDQLSAVALKLNLTDWFVGVDLAGCVGSGALTVDAATNTVSIDKDTQGTSDACKSIGDTIKHNIEQSMEFEKDDESKK